MAIFEDRDRAVFRFNGRLREFDPFFNIGVVVLPKVVGFQK